MNLKNDFKDLYKKLVSGVIEKSLVISLMVALFVLTAVSLTLWIKSVNQYWIGLIAFFITWIIAFFVTFAFLKPSEKQFAKKLDDLGLKQRVATMNQYRDDDSLMARIQRQNALQHISKIDKKLIKTATPITVMILVAIAFVLGASSTTAAALSSKGIILNGKEVIEDIIPGIKNEYEVVYDVDGEGYIEGDFFQIVEEGGETTPVMAVAEDGWAFIEWSDGYSDPYRQDIDITENIEVYAKFQELVEGDGSGDGDPQEGTPGENDQQGAPSEDQAQGQPGSQSKNDGEGDGTGEGGEYTPSNQIIDNETYYGDKTYENAYGDAVEQMNGNGNMSDGEKSVIEDYMKNIEK